VRAPWLLGALVASLATAGGAVALRHRSMPGSGTVSVGQPPSLETPQDLDEVNAPYDAKYHFVRVRYQPRGRSGFGFGRGRGGGPPWFHDYPRAERNFVKILDETTFIHPLLDGSNILTFDDPRIFQYPIAYIVEVGAWEPTESEVEGLAAYLRKGGFLIVDDFRGSWDLANFEFQFSRVLPGAQLVQLDETHEIFDSFFRIDPEKVVPPYGARYPIFYGIFEDNDREKRLVAIVNYDNDIAEYWEFSDYGYFPIDLSNEAYKLGVNYIVYGMTH